MFKPLRNTNSLSQILLGALALQVCVLSINGAPERKATLSLNSLSNTLGNRRLEVGSPAPMLSVYDRNGWGAALPSSSGNVTLVFRAACNCEDTAVWNWVQVAKRAKEPVALVAVVPPEQLAKVHSPEPGFEQVFCCRRVDFEQIAPRIRQSLPCAVHIRNGKVVSLDTSES